MTAAPTAPNALAEPVVRVRARWVGLLVLANLAVFMGFFTPIQQLLPEQIQAIRDYLFTLRGGPSPKTNSGGAKNANNN